MIFSGEEELMTLSILALALLGLSGVGASAQNVDFGEMSQNEQKSRNISKLLTETEQLWRGKTENLQIETGVLAEELLVITTTDRRLRVSLGQDLNLLEGDASRRIPGKILFLDAHSLPNRSNRALATVTFLTGDEFRTNVYVATEESGELSIKRFDSRAWNLIRPVGDRMLSQVFDPNDLWEDELTFLRTTRSGYENDQSADFPDDTRLMSLSRLPDRRWVGTNAEGNLVLHKDGEILSTVRGDFGARAHVLKPLQSNWRREDKAEPVRLAPQHVEGEPLIVVMENPPVKSGLEGFFSTGNTPSALKFYSFRNDQLTERTMVGPFDHRILDVEVPPANPDQLLWLRKLRGNRVVLEMLDMSKL